MRMSDRIGTPVFYSETHAAAHEAALLVAAGRRDAAIQLLERETAGAGGVPDRQAWLVLFSCYRHAGERERFDRLLPLYSAAFPGATPPSWSPPNPTVAPGVVAAPAALAQGCDFLQRLVAHAAGRRTLAIDMAGVETIDFGYTGSLAATLRALGIQGKRVLLANISEAHAALLEAFDVHTHATLLRRGGAEAAVEKIAVAA